MRKLYPNSCNISLVYAFVQVCLHCLTRIAASQTRETGAFRCPICRELITIPRGGVPALPPSFLVNQLLDLMSRQRREVWGNTSSTSLLSLPLNVMYKVSFIIAGYSKMFSSHKPGITVLRNV